MSKQEKLITAIKALSDSIREKQRALKSDISRRDEYLQTTFQPVIKPLKEVVDKLNRVPSNESESIEPIKMREDYSDSENVSATTDHESDAEDEIEDKDELTDEDKGEEESNLTVLSKEMPYQSELSRKYVVKMLHGTLANRVHHVYGARLEKEGLMIGDSKLNVDESDNIIIKGVSYPGTSGLFELIFKKIPAKYTSQDLKWFKKICLATNLHKKQYKTNSPIHKGSSQKYRNIISRLFPNIKSVGTTGRGISFKDAKTPNVIYYNNINKLVSRLRLLHEAQQVGHTGVGNEIVALTEELRHRGYIE